jgi:hypothetical protein
MGVEVVACEAKKINALETSEDQECNNENDAHI